jgi:hypothetical protein
MSVAELEAGLQSLVSRIYSDEVTKARRAAFHRNYRGKLRQRKAQSSTPGAGYGRRIQI